MSSGTIATKGRRAGQSPWVGRLGRLGLVAKGALYAVVGILAINVALSGRDEERPDREGALRAIGEQPLGKGLLVLLAAGLAGHALWRLAQAVLDRDGAGTGPKALVKRAGSLARAGWYSLLCGLTVSTLVGEGGGGNEQQATAGVFDRPLGRYAVYAAGIGFLAFAAFNGYRAVTTSFNKKLKQGEMSEAEETAATGVGILGHLARGIVFGLVGAFLVKAAWEFDPQQARGLDGALLEVSKQTYGGALLGTVAVGLLAYAAYCLVQAKYRRV